MSIYSPNDCFSYQPLIVAPLSEMYGRTWVLHICNLFSLAFNLGCAFAPSVGSLIAFRFLGKGLIWINRFYPSHSHQALAGFSGSAPICIGGGTVADLFSERDRATAMAVWSLGPLIGTHIPNFIGPVSSFIQTFQGRSLDLLLADLSLKRLV